MNKREKMILAVLSLTASAVMALYLYRQNNGLTLTEYKIKSNKLPGSFEGFKIVHISDLHNKRFGKHNSRLIKLIREQQPDIITISGDLADSRHTDLPTALEFVRLASQIAPLCYTTGNHEHRLDSAVLTKFLDDISAAGGIVLEDSEVFVVRGNDRICIAGMSDRRSPTRESLENLLSPAGDMLSILIAHRPHNAPIYASAGADITLSGHAHGGQARLPFVGGIIAPDQGFFPKYTEGVHYFDGCAAVISRGLGNSLCPIRFNNPPEVVAVTLTQAG